MELGSIQLQNLETILILFIQEYEDISGYENEVTLAREIANTICGWIKAWFDEAAF